VTVSALYVDPAGIYPRVLGAERCWDLARDARTYAGPDPVVAHPPCQLWVNLAAVNYKRYGHLPAWYPGGTDGGCFAAALAAVRQWGGVLEHPANSHAFRVHDVTLKRGSAPAGWAHIGHNLWICEVWQSAYGHPARKRTWLLYASPIGRAPFDLNWSREPGTHQVGWFDRVKPTLNKKDAMATPPAFAEMLLALAAHSRSQPCI
jgi:hypothetical protein